MITYHFDYISNNLFARAKRITNFTSHSPVEALFDYSKFVICLAISRFIPERAAESICGGPGEKNSSGESFCGVIREM
jgi:hypothetical protein